MDLKPEFQYLTVELTKKQTRVFNSVHFYIPVCLWSFLAVFGFWGTFGGIDSFMGAPLGAPMRSLTPIVTLNLCQVQPPVQLGKFIDFWGMLIIDIFG